MYKNVRLKVQYYMAGGYFNIKDKGYLIHYLRLILLLSEAFNTNVTFVDYDIYALSDFMFS